MKKLTIILSLIAITILSTQAQGRLEVKVSNIKQTSGTIRVGLFTSEETFLKKPVEGKVVKVTGSEAFIVFDSLKSGEYGISVVHDENDNGDIDSNAFGIPTEGFAFGNNAMGMFGPPSFEKAKVIVRDSETSIQTITIKYL